MEPTEVDNGIVVLHVFATLERGGAELRTLEMLRKLQGASKQHVTTLSGRGGVLAKDFEAAGASVSILNVRSILFPMQFRRLLKRERVNVVHAHVSLYSGYVLYLAKVFGVRGRVVHFRSESTGIAAGLAARFQAHVLRRLVDLSANVIVGVSPSSLGKSWSPRWPSDERCRVLVSGVDLDVVERGLDDAPTVRAELGIGADCKMILHVGRDIPTKNRVRAIDIFAEMGRRPSALLVFVGRDDPASRRRLEDQAWRLGVLSAVRFLGERMDVQALMPAADLLLVTSTLEGMPGVVVEASAAATPVLATDLDGTIYISERLRDITIMRQELSDTLWAAEADLILATVASPILRKARIASVRGTEFDVTTAIQGYVDIWETALAGHNS